jgi:hypothetical protein
MNKAPPVTPDPNFAPEQLQAQQDLISGLQVQTQGDMASLMARYGTHLALAGGTTSPLVAPGLQATAANRAI